MKKKGIVVLVIFLFFGIYPMWCGPLSDEYFMNFQSAQSMEEDTDSLALEAVEVILEEMADESESELLAVEQYRLAILYDSLIHGASSWMKYSGLRNEALDISLQLNPDSLDTNVFHTRRLLFGDTSDGGDPEAGRIKLENLLKEKGSEISVLLLAGDYSREQDDIQQAKEYYSAIISIDPESMPAAGYVRQISAAEAGLTIREIRIAGEIKTKAKNLPDMIKSFEGVKYSLETENELNAALEIFPSVNGVSISILESDDETITLEVKVNENNRQVVVAMLDVYTNLKADQSLGFGPMFNVAYVNSNLFGSGLEFTGVFAGVYLRTEFVIPEHKGLDLDLGLRLSGLALSGEKQFYDNQGDYQDWIIQTSPNINAAVFLQKEWGFGLKIKSIHNIGYNSYSSSTGNFIAPTDKFAYTGDLLIEMSMQGQGASIIDPVEGMKIELKPVLQYRFDYNDWGPSGNLYTHNPGPGYKAHYLISYGLSPTDWLNLTAQLSYLHGINLYALDEWEVGQTSLFNAYPRLSGYYGAEFRTSGSPLLNLDLLFRLPGNRVGIIIKHDVFLHGEENAWYQGTGLFVPFKLGDNFELGAYGNIGWNANHVSTAWNAGVFGKYMLIK